MNKSLVVVESPAKAKTIEKFLGKNYMVLASMGHLRDLPKSQFGVDIENNFLPKYINIRGKGELIQSLKKAAKAAKKVFLATDPDREGEAIAWHLAHILNIPTEKACRIEFNEITKPAVVNAIKHPRPIDLPRVDAQQTRRILDRIVGYKLSPLLWRKVRKGLSAGRVQSVAVRLICDRETEINEFVQEEYWTITAKVREKAGAAQFDAELVAIAGQKAEIHNQQQADDIAADLKLQNFAVTAVKRRERRRNPYPPFTTSSLQQEAARRLGFTSRKTMLIAQQLYEGLEIGKSGPVGLISYIRTDSTRVAETAQQDARNYILGKYGTQYVPEKAPVYRSKNSQDAHEAIRPTDIGWEPAQVAKDISSDQLKLYSLIWARFVASQMTPAVYDTLTVDIQAGKYALRSIGSHLKFSGFLAVYQDSKDEQAQEKDVLLPEMVQGQILKLAKIFPKQHFTQPPPRYTEASLIKTLEEKEIGRPSTYAPIIETIISRNYVIRLEKKFHPTELGLIVVDLLKKYFPDIVNVEFTAGLEGKLDEIADGNESRFQVLQEFFAPFSVTLKNAEEEIGHVEIPEQVSDTPCEHCGRMMVIKHGRYGDFLACPGFPECRNTKPLLKEIGVPCPVCGSPLVERRTKRGRIFFGCKNYPQCNFVTWDMPLAEKCPQCGHFMVRHKFKNGGVSKICGSSECPTRKTDDKAGQQDPKSTNKRRRKQSG